jgi:ABC-type branched-subunit amino acid transport system permease subunit
MLLGSGGKSGSWSLSSTQQGQYHLSLVGHAAFVGLGSYVTGILLAEGVTRDRLKR